MPAIKPDDFNRFWDDVDASLARTPAATTVYRDVRPTRDGIRVHRLEFASLDGVRVGGWLTVPDRDGPHPTVTIFPGYKSDPMPAIGWARRGYQVFSLAHRGKLGSTATFNPGYPGMLTHGITDKHTYAYKGVYADCMRALEVVSALSDTAGPQAVYGYSQGGPLSLMATARRPEHVGAVVAGAPFLTAFAYSVLAARTYPYFEIPEYLAQHQQLRDTVFGTLNYFDALHVVADITCPLFMFRAGADEICPPFSTTLLHALAPAGTRWKEYEESGHDATGVRAVGDAAAFFAEILGAPTPVDTVTHSPTNVSAGAPSAPPLLDQARAGAKVRDRHDLSATHHAAAHTSFLTVDTPDGAAAGAYVSVPHTPVNGMVVEFSGYTSVVSLAHPEDRERFPLATLAHRGQRGAHQSGELWMLPGIFDGTPAPTAARFNQMLADNLAVLTTVLDEMHTPGTPLIGVGPDWIVALAVLSGAFTHIEVDSFWLTDVGRDTEFEYPRRELHEHIKTGPDLLTELAWCDPCIWAAKLDADLLVVTSDTPAGLNRAQKLTNAHPGQHSVRVADARSAIEAEWRDARRAAILGVSPAVRWQTARTGVRL